MGFCRVLKKELEHSSAIKRQSQRPSSSALSVWKSSKSINVTDLLSEKWPYFDGVEHLLLQLEKAAF